jgi:hypothetical protein
MLMTCGVYFFNMVRFWHGTTGLAVLRVWGRCSILGSATCLSLYVCCYRVGP